MGRSWFRYHHLLTDLLQLELRRTSPAIVGSLHRAAAQWFEGYGYMVDAVRHSQAARDWEHAARLLADNYVELVFEGRKATLRALLAAFPAGAPEADAELALAFATARLYDGLLDEVARTSPWRSVAETVPDERKGCLMCGWPAQGSGWHVSAGISLPRSRRCVLEPCSRPRRDELAPTTTIARRR
jgi:LuxR family maltose regulon positive regulatory protein